MLVRVPPEAPAQDAIAEIHDHRTKPGNGEWVVEADITACFDVPSHCPFCCWGLVEETAVGGVYPDPQALSASGADVDGANSPRLTRCNTVWRETPSALVASRIGSQPGGASLDEAGAQLVGEADVPGCAWGELLAGDEAVVAASGARWREPRRGSGRPR